MTHFGQRGACSMGCRRYHPSHQRASEEPCSLGVRRAAILLAASSMSRGMNCIFCRPQRAILAETKLSLAVLDGFPVSKGQSLFGSMPWRPIDPKIFTFTGKPGSQIELAADAMSIANGTR